MTGKNNDPAAGKGAAGDDNKTKGAAADTDKEGDDLQAEVEKWKGLARQHEGLWKSTGLTKDELPEAKALLAKAKDSDLQSKTAEDRIIALEQKIAATEARSIRLEVAAAKGLSPSLAARLMGATREELEADADELLKDVKPASSTENGDKQGEGDKSGSGGTSDRSRPRESLRSGTAPNAEPEDNDPTKLAALIPRG